MNRIEKKFNELEVLNKKATITYFSIDYSQIEKVPIILDEILKTGTDIIEIDLSSNIDQKSNYFASITNLFKCIYKIRNIIENPIIIIINYENIIKFGITDFYNLLYTSDIDGIFITNLDKESCKLLMNNNLEKQIEFISILSPNSQNIFPNNESGFLYCISTRGVTGSRICFDTNFI